MVLAGHSEAQADSARREARPATATVQVWTGWLDVVGIELMRLAGRLTEQERSDAAALPSMRDEVRFVATHGIVREIVGAALGREPRDLPLVADTRGSLQLAGEGHGLGFSVSTSSGLLLCALGYDRAVGVDVERLRSSFAGAGGGDEGSVHDIEPSIRAWTRHEAERKAREAHGGEEPFTALDFDPCAGYVATVAATGEDWVLEQRWWASAGSSEPPAFVGMSMPEADGA
jgi:hypothetical protein